ncbi:MAG: DUF3299 domain-containing protein [Aquabacterium sp.]|nr:DUF3299 domain-containing protein [Aquabacterium sp.]
MPTPRLDRRHWLQTAAGLLAACSLPLAAQPKPTANSAGYTEIRWDDLVPKGWDPTKAFKDQGMTNLAALNDGDPKAAALMAQLREAWDNAPTEPQLNGTRVKLPGYLVPLEEVAAGHTEFLLVPYFGACIHTPPPPANQIVLVVPAKPAGGFRSMDTVWVSGILKTTRNNSPMGTSGYRLETALVERYKAPAR